MSKGAEIPTELLATFRSTGQVLFRVKVLAHAAKCCVMGLLDNGTVKIAIQAPRDKGKANDALIRFLAEQFGTHRQNVSIVAGETQALKLVRVGV